MNIQFFNESVRFEIADTQAHITWLAKCCKLEGFEIGELSFIFCSDEYLLSLNVKYLNHDYYTDVISFPLSTGNEPLSGDIFISIDRVKENAEQLKEPFEQEIKRVMIHGLLHFMGYSDKSKSEAAKMCAKENKFLLIF